MKKFFAAVLTLVMVASLSVPVFAQTLNTASAGSAITSSGDYTGLIKIPTLNVKLTYYGATTPGGTANNKLILNPYGATIKSDTTVGSTASAAPWITASDGITDQVIASPVNVKSWSDSAVDVVLASGAHVNNASTITMQTKEINNTKAVASAQAYLYMCATSGEDDSKDKIPTEWPSYDKNNCWLMSADSTKDITLYTLPATDGTNAVYCWVSITGNLSSMFTDTGTPWTSSDTINPTGSLKFNFAMASE